MKNTLYFALLGGYFDLIKYPNILPDILQQIYASDKKYRTNQLILKTIELF